jgi:hypothetical protein
LKRLRITRRLPDKVLDAGRARFTVTLIDFAKGRPMPNPVER